MNEAKVRPESASRLEHVYRQHGERLWRSVFLFSGDRDLASDAVAEAFAQALRRGDAVHSLDAWLWRTAFKVAAGMLKARNRPLPESRASAYEMSQETVDLVRALRSLSPKQRQAVILHYYGDSPIREVAALMNSSAAAVGVHLHRARNRLRSTLEVRDD